MNINKILINIRDIFTPNELQPTIRKFDASLNSVSSDYFSAINR